jgi:hypothetical protein
MSADAWPDEAAVERAAIALGQFIAELPDRTSPEDNPQAMTIYESEIDRAVQQIIKALCPYPSDS